MFRSVLAFHQRALARWPVTTQSVSAGVIGLCGDGICQFLVDKRPIAEYDPVRGLRFFVLSACYIAPILSQWFKVLDCVRGNPRLLPFKRVLIDQLFFAPPFSASIILNLHMLQGYSVLESWTKLKEHFVDIYKRSILFWPFVQIFNFSVVPLRYQVLVVQLAALLWNAFLSYKTQTREPLPPLE